MATDCIPCHFAWEERHALPLLPMAERCRILVEHEELRRDGYPAEKVIEHSEREMVLFRRHLPAAMLREIHNDHQRFMPMLDHCAANGEPVPTDRIADGWSSCCKSCRSSAAPR